MLSRSQMEFEELFSLKKETQRNDLKIETLDLWKDEFKQMTCSECRRDSWEVN